MHLSIPHLPGWLDRRLAAGASPGESAGLRRRARKLTSKRRRRELAAAIFRLVDEADGPAKPFSAAVPIQRRAVDACRELLLMVAEDLEDTGLRVNPKGVALVDQLLRDGGSPVYAPLGERALEEAVRHARAALLLE
jgi:hypothetical protein